MHRLLPLALCAAAAILPRTAPAPLAASPELAQPARPGTGLVPSLDAIFRDACPQPRPGPGAVAIVAREGRPIYRKACGLADLEFGVMLDVDMRFRIGSLTKQFTAAAILLLAEQGKLALDDDVRTHVPSWPADRPRITVEHLLTHTAGLPNYTALPSWALQMTRDVPPLALVDFFKDLPPEFPPGERFAYSNSGYVLAGLVVEAAAGMGYGDFMRQHVFLPLGLSNTIYDNPRAVIPRRVKGYQGSAGDYANAGYVSMTQPYAAGALLSTADDLAAWDAALTNGRLLKPASVERMFAPYRLSSGRRSAYALGWRVIRHDGRTVAEHGGGINGFLTHVVRMADDGVYAAVLSNNATGEISPAGIARRLAAQAAGRPVHDPPATSLPSGLLDQYVGTYRQEDGDEITIGHENGRLVVKGGSGRERPLEPIAVDRFFVPGDVDRFEFVRDPSDRVQGVTQSGWGEPVRAVRH